MSERQKTLLPELIIRRAESPRDYRDCEKVQYEAWGIPDSELVPLHILKPMSEKGGLVINAYDMAGRPVGTSISFLASVNGRLVLYSHMTGVVPEYQSRGVGLALKLKQREYAIDRNLDLVCWTYDPMQSLNNWFNLNKLGVIARTYYVDYYGDMLDRLNRGLQSDRFFAEWYVQSGRVEKRLTSSYPLAHEAPEGSLVVNPSMLKHGLRSPPEKANLELAEQSVFVEIPYGYDSYRKSDPALLQAWRAMTRRVYQHYFSLGYVATAAAVDESEPKRSFVKLERGPLERILQS